MTKKGTIVMGSRTYQILCLLYDGDVHLTTEIEKPPRTRSWETSQAEDRLKWFIRAREKDYVEQVKPYGGTDKWRITELGIKVLEECV